MIETYYPCKCGCHPSLKQCDSCCEKFNKPMSEQLKNEIFNKMMEDFKDKIIDHIHQQEEEHKILFLTSHSKMIEELLRNTHLLLESFILPRIESRTIECHCKCHVSQNKCCNNCSQLKNLLEENRNLQIRLSELEHKYYKITSEDEDKKKEFYSGDCCL